MARREKNWARIENFKGEIAEMPWRTVATSEHISLSGNVVYRASPTLLA